MTYRPNLAALIATATASRLGLVKPDGSTIVVGTDGTLASASGQIGLLTGAAALDSADLCQVSRAGTNLKATSRIVAAYVHGMQLVRVFGGIGDGSVHTIATATSDHPLYGVTTLAQLAAVQIAGNAPFAFVTQAPFTGSAWTLTDAKVPQLDLDWLAIQACLWTAGSVRLPKGLWIVGSALPLPLLIRESLGDYPSLYGNPSQIVGEGPSTSVIKAGSDFGVGVPLISCGDPGATKANGLGRYGSGVNGAGLYLATIAHLGLLGPNQNFTIGSPPCGMTGLAWGSRVTVDDCQINFFGKGISIVGDGHAATFRNVQSLYCGYACYWDEPSVYLYGDTDFDGCSFAGTSIGAIGVHGSGTVLGATFKGKTYLNGPYGIFAETGGTGAQIINSVRFEKLMGEWLGNALVHDENAFQGGVYGTGAKRDISTLTIESVFCSQDNSKFWGGNGRGRVAWIDCRNIENMVINGFDVDAAQYAPTQGPSGPAPLAFIRARNMAGSKGGILLRGPIQSLFANLAASGVPLFNADVANPSACGFEQPGVLRGRTGFYVNVYGATSVAIGDLLERYFEANCAAGLTALAPAAGIALMPASSNGVLPIAMEGYNLMINSGVNPVTNNVPLVKCSGIRKVAVSANGSGGTAGAYTDGAFSGGGGSGAAFSYTIKSDGTLDPATVIMTAHGTGYTSAPSVVFGHGLAGVTASAIWPSGLVQPGTLGVANGFGWSIGGGNGQLSVILGRPL